MRRLLRLGTVVSLMGSSGVEEVRPTTAGCVSIAAVPGDGKSAILLRALRVSRLTVPLLTSLVAAACGGGGSPSGPDSPPPGTAVSGVVFYDENANGALDAFEV